jgi:hypothetical protein
VCWCVLFLFLLPSVLPVKLWFIWTHLA